MDVLYALMGLFLWLIFVFGLHRLSLEVNKPKKKGIKATHFIECAVAESNFSWYTVPYPIRHINLSGKITKNMGSKTVAIFKIKYK